MPVSIDNPGKQTGDSVSHYIREGGPFDKACAAYREDNLTVLFQDRAYQAAPGVEGPLLGAEGGDASARAERERNRKAASKTKFTCPNCDQDAWGARSSRLLCGGGDCKAEKMLAEDNSLSI